LQIDLPASLQTNYRWHADLMSLCKRQAALQIGYGICLACFTNTTGCQVSCRTIRMTAELIPYGGHNFADKTLNVGLGREARIAL
jgi:hypothetical protein